MIQAHKTGLGKCVSQYNSASIVTSQGDLSSSSKQDFIEQCTPITFNDLE